LQKPFNKPKNDFPWGINKCGQLKGVFRFVYARFEARQAKLRFE